VDSSNIPQELSPREKETKVVHVVKHSSERRETSEEVGSLIDERMAKYLVSITDMCKKIESKVETVATNMK